jgi:NADH-quinone oxidoreductase subunit L
MIDYVWLVPGLPLLGFLINGLFGKRISKPLVGWIACGSVGLSFAFALKIFFELLSYPSAQRLLQKILFPWVLSGNFHIDIGFQIDPLSSVMVLVVSGVGFLIHIYSVGYMGKDPGYSRYFAYLNLFVFSMLTLVLANNFLLLYLGWEGVGLCSYLLIGFWYDKKSAADAGKKAFITTRIGDFGFALGVMLLFWSFGTLNYTQVFSQASSVLSPGGALATTITLLLFLGAVGKSAQIPLYVWLPDAMEGPTPVSALIHAATMVTAGVYMVARCHVLYELAPLSMMVVAIIGAATAIYSASIALVQNDIKRILAYSTISQLGYMFLACGVGAFAAGIFHLVTHAFFKALLFLGAGSVMHALSGELDLRKMGDLRKYLPITFWCFFAAVLAISGIPFFSGFFSKDEILWKAYLMPQGGLVLWVVGLFTAGMTAFYMFRLFFSVFLGKSKVEENLKPHIHESPKSMTIPMSILAVLSIIGGYIGVPHSLGGGDNLGKFLSTVFEESSGRSEAIHHSYSTEYLFMFLSIGMVLIGIFIAHRMYIARPELPKRLAERYKGAYKVLLNKYYVDEFYDLIVVRPFINLALLLWNFLDTKIIDGFANGSASTVGLISGIVRKIQTGYTRNYALSLLLGAIAILAYYVLR